ncbi:MAG: hypothetical protein JWP89_2746 [Schlesneria sp.]|nr:hypothetical protein [Schlesneria sp.]
MQYAIHDSPIKLLVAAVEEVGPAAQALGGILVLTTKSTFTEAKKIASQARLPPKTFRNQLQILQSAGWIQNKGRQTTRTGRARRTNTIELTHRVHDGLKDFLPLPQSAAAAMLKETWSTRVIWAVVVRRVLELTSGLKHRHPEGFEWSELETVKRLEMLGSDRFGFSISLLQRRTGLSRDSIIAARHRLAALKMVCAREGVGHQDSTILIPNWSLKLVTRYYEGDRVAFRWG